MVITAWASRSVTATTLVELLNATVHRIGARAERRVTNELINALKKVTGRENILFSIAEAAVVNHVPLAVQLGGGTRPLLWTSAGT